MRIAVLASFNVDLLPPRLSKALERAGLPNAGILLGKFGQILREAVNPASRALYPPPDAIIVIPAFDDALDARDIQTATDALLTRLPNTTVYLVTFGTDALANSHLLEPTIPQRGQAAVEEFMIHIRDEATVDPRIVVVDWDWHNRSDYFDARLWYLARMRLNPAGLDALADLIAVHMAANAGIVRKALAVDLDGTLWGGVIGEDGITGIQIGNEGIGLAYQDSQREILKIRDTGVVLVAASKNNDTDALAVFDHHPGMLIHRDDFVTARINWDNKAESLAAMADELGLGIDTFVLLDDDPRERDYVRRALPQVAVPELPADPAYRPRFLRDLTLFRRISLTSADVNRSATYAANVARKKTQVGLSLEDYIRSLEQVIDIRPVDEGSLSRATQLCARTNQFNLTGSRYALANLEAMSHNPAVEMFTVAVRDRFGDSGIVGLVITRSDKMDRAIDSLMISCRALGRGIEDALLKFVIDRSRERGDRSLVGIYVPTAKNGQAADFYERMGFEKRGTGVFVLSLVRESAHA